MHRTRPPRRPRSAAAVRALASGALLGGLLGAASCSAPAPVATSPGPTTAAGAATTTGSARAGTTLPEPPGTGGPTGTTGTAPRTAPPRSTARITRFEVPASIACNGLVTVKVPATYATAEATSVAFLVDNQQVTGSPPLSGSFELPMRCDGSTHTIVLSAIDDQGRSAVQSKAVLTDDRQSGG